tara:strand:+ start:2571 stop:2813 length:243 start_codon:yes stop_codon:yes gene_type:complete
MKDDEIARNILVVFYFDNVTWFDVLPLSIFEALSSLIILDCLLLVLAFIALVPLEVLEGVLENGNDNDTSERSSLNRLTL